MGNLIVPKAKVEIPGTDSTFSVRGLSPTDAAVLLNEHRHLLTDMFARYVKNNGADPSDDELGAIATVIMGQAPRLLSDAIALASAEDPEEVAQLSVAVQLDAITKIFELTFGREEGLKKFAATLIQMFRAVSQSVKTLTA